MTKALLTLFCAGLFLPPLRAQDSVSTTVEESPAAAIVDVKAPDESLEQNPADEGNLVAGNPFSPPEFNSGRRFQLSANLLGGYDDNVNRRSEGSPSWFATPSVSSSYSIGTPRLALKLLVGGGLTYYFDHPGGRDYDPNAQVRLALTYKLSSRLSSQASVTVAYQAQPDFSDELSSLQRRGNFLRSEEALSFTYQWHPRFSTTAGYKLSVIEYDNPASSFLDRAQQSFNLNGRFLLLPGTAISAEAGFTDFTYFNAASRDSVSENLLLGIQQTFSKGLDASLRAGAQFRQADAGTDRTSPFLELNAGYKIEPRIDINWSSRYSIEESDTAAVNGQTTFRTHLNLKYRITARISSTLAFTYSHREGGAGEGKTRYALNLAPSVRYSINRHFGVNVGYAHAEVDSGSQTTATSGRGRSYSSNRYFAGVNFVF